MRDACAWVVERARDVGIGDLAPALQALKARKVPGWDRRRHYSGPPDRTLAYILVLDATNFCFWGGPGGYWRLAEGLREAFRAEVPFWEPSFLRRVEVDDLRRWIGELPLMAERVESLHQLGRLDSLAEMVEESAAATAAGLARRVASFADVATYEGREVPLLKRAQIVAADLHGAGVCAFQDLDSLTCFADYKLPQALRHLGALEYSEALTRRVDDWQELTSGEAAEVEIRAATVVAVERLRDELAAAGRELRAFEVDWMLWELSQGLYPVRPHHRVRSIYY